MGMFCCFTKPKNKRKNRESEINRNEIVETNLIESSKISEIQEKFERQIGQKNETISELENKITFFDSKLDKANQQIEILNKDLQNIKDQNDKLVRQNEKLKSENESGHGFGTNSE